MLQTTRTDTSAPAGEPTLSRREQNKLSTRQAIATAALNLMRAHGHAALTVEMVADEAHVSRRTFFNYYSSIDDALGEHIRVVLETAFEELDAVSTDTSIFDATFIAFSALVTSRTLEPVAFLCAADTHTPSLRAAALYYWQEYAEKFAQRIIAKRPELDPFEVAIYAQNTIGACNIAFEHWGATLAGPPTDQDLKHLEALLTRALEVLRFGFTSISENTTEQGA